MKLRAKSPLPPFAKEGSGGISAGIRIKKDYFLLSSAIGVTSPRSPLNILRHPESALHSLSDPVGFSAVPYCMHAGNGPLQFPEKLIVGFETGGKHHGIGFEEEW